MDFAALEVREKIDLVKERLPREAEVVYWEDLSRHPDNGWALFGLRQALEAQGKAEQAADIDARFRKAWASADFELTSSRALDTSPVRARR